jgi:small subunit ribosomal protein S9
VNLFARLIHCLIGWLKHIAAPKRAADREQPPHSVTLRESQRDEEETRRELEEAPIDKQHDTVSSAETLTIATSEQHRTDEQPLISNGLDAVPTASLKSPDAPPTQLPSIEKTRDAGKHTPFDLDLEAPEQPAPDSQPTSKSAVADQPYTSNEAQSEPRDSRERPVRPPEKRGGRPRDPRSFDKEPRKTKDGVRASRPEIVCWKRGREWVVGVEMPDGISQSSNLVVVQASSSLAEDGSRPGCWPLAKLNTAVAVQIGDGSLNQTINIAMGDEDWLLFKLSGRNLDHGRKVKQASSGLYLAIVPKSWVRDAEEGGTAPTADEPVFLEGYRAHFFELIETTSSCIAFRNDRGDPIVIGSSGPQFRLIGHEMPDASEQIGSLFAEEPPRVQILNADWSSVSTIVVGQEGSSRHRWRTSFKPKDDRTEQELPGDVRDRKTGWYFLRFYDSTDTLIDSLDFRFVAGLKRISILADGPAPSSCGHVPRTVEVLHDAGYSVQMDDNYADVTVERTSEKTIIQIPARPESERTRWLIQPPQGDGEGVKFEILIERVWWALSKESMEPSQWRDRPVRLSPEQFAGTCDRAIWLRFPKPRWVNAVSAGFRQRDSRWFYVKVTDMTVRIPLRDFSGVQELNERAVEHKFKVWLEIGQITHEVTIAVLPAVAQVTPLAAEWGRYKTAIAKARLQTGSSKINVNGVLVGQYFSHAPHKARFFLEKLCALREVEQTLSTLDVDVTVRGSSPKTIRQAKAVVHAIARALWSYDRTLMRPLKQAGCGGASVTQKHKAYWVRRVNDESR